jgi:Arc/MetJ-type ribon-helix-helix transcriptional regulator
MKTLSLKLPDSLADQLEALASTQRTSKSAVVREAISAYLKETSAPARVSFTALAGDLAGSIEGPEDLSVNPGHRAGYGR